MAQAKPIGMRALEIGGNVGPFTSIMTGAPGGSQLSSEGGSMGMCSRVHGPWHPRSNGRVGTVKESVSAAPRGLISRSECVAA